MQDEDSHRARAIAEAAAPIPPSPAAPAAAAPATPGVFVTGSLLRHILVMSGASAIGLVAIFLSDFINLVFLGRLQDAAIPAAIGFAATALYVSISLGIGLSIAAVALVAPALGAGDRDRALRASSSVLVFSAALSAAITAIAFPFIPAIVAAFGGTGRAGSLAAIYLQVILPTTPLLVLGIATASVLRALGDARISMWVTLGAALANVVFDAVLILGFKLGLEGAAIATAASRFVLAGIGLWGLSRHGFLPQPSLAAVRRDIAPILGVALPAIATNVATPFGSGYVTMAFAPYGDAAVGAWASLNRLIPVAMAFAFALSGAIGPILGQNWGAGAIDRVRRTAQLSFAVTTAYLIAAWAVLAVIHPLISDAFGLLGPARDLMALFCIWLMPFNIFVAVVFVTGAAFNNLGRPTASTALNWGRATLGTIPFVLAGGYFAGAEGVLIGNFLGAVPFAALALWLLFRHIDRLPSIPRNNARR